MNRLDHIDIAKGISMICIIIGHYSSVPYLENSLLCFDVPAFFIIAGVFAKDTSSKILLTKSFKRLLLPLFYAYICTFCLLCILYYKLNFLKIGNDINVAKELFNSHLIGEWFIYALFISRLFYNILSKYISDRKGLALSLFIFVVSQFCVNEFAIKPYDYYCFFQALCALFFMFIGNIFKDEIKDKKVPDFSICLCSILILALSSNVKMNFYANYFDHSIFTVFCSFIICFALFETCKLIAMFKIVRRILCFVGSSSLLILCIHMVENKLQLYYKINNVVHQDYISLILLIILIVFTALIIDNVKRHFSNPQKCKDNKSL